MQNLSYQREGFADNMSRTSVRVRYLITLISNILRVGLSFISGLVIARTLGPGKYGDFNFLLGSFTALATLVDMASSSAFYTFISQKKRGRNFFLYYTTWLLLQFFILLFFTLVLPASFTQKIWLGHSGHLILFALFASFTMNQLWRFAGQIGESIRDTFGVQIRNFSLAAVYLICVLVLAELHVISIKNLFILNILSYFLFFALYVRRIYRTGNLLNDKREEFEGVFDEFKGYCSPLVIYTAIGFLYTFADYWLLQKYGGSTQQGYYAIGARFSALSLIATTSMLQVFWKEIAEANSLGNIERVRLLYRQVSRSLYFIGAMISCIMIPFSREILALLLGPSYREAWLPLSLMFLYPIHQSMGQITGTMLYATGKTKAQSYIGIYFMAISIPTAYILLAPNSAILPGFQLGAMGLAIKMVGCQILGVNISAFFVARYINTSFDWSHQINVLFFLLPIGFLSKLFAEHILTSISFCGYTILVMGIASVFYVIIVTILIRFYPPIAGINKDQINQGLSWLLARIKAA
jgi:O-antigen/teichoic acid export membrane protein